MKVRIPAKLLLVSATLFSTTVSFIGGLILYLESIKAVEDTVQEIALSETLSATHILKTTMNEVRDAGLRQGEILRMWHPFRTEAEFLDWYTYDAFSHIRDKELYGVGIVAIFNHSQFAANATSEPSGVKHTVWWDPLTNPEFIRKEGADRMYLAAYTSSALRLVPCVDGEVQPYCNIAVKLHPQTGVLTENMYNYSFAPFEALRPGSAILEQLSGWEEQPVSHWQDLWTWVSPDNTSYDYCVHYTVQPIIKDPASELFQDTMIVSRAFLMFNQWADLLVQMKIESRVIVMSNTQVLASNAWTGAERDCSLRNIKADDTSGIHHCAFLLDEQDPHVIEAVRILQSAPDAHFLKRSLPGGDYFILRRTILEPSPRDNLNPIYLVWLRNVSTVEDKLLRSLLFFVGFIALVLIFDAGIVVIEIKKIGQPLGTLTRAVEHIDTMDLDGAVQELDKQNIGDSCFTVKDTDRLWRSFRCTIASLREYRSYLPHAILACNDEDDDAPDEASTISVPRQFSRRSKSSFKTSEDDSVSEGGPSRRISARKSNSGRKRSIFTKMAKVDRRLVSFAVLNVLGTHDAEPSERHGRIRALLSSCLVETQQGKGVVEGVVGDRVRCSWNASRPAFRHRAHALHVTLNATGPWMSSAVVSCDAFCGSQGSMDMRYYLIEGPRVSFCFVLERLAAREAHAISSKLPRTGVSVTLCDGAIHLDTSATVAHRWFGEVKYDKLTPMMKVWHAVKMKDDTENEEWMYQMAKEGVWDTYNKALHKVLQGTIAEAESAVSQLPEGLPVLTTFYVDRIKGYIQDKARPVSMRVGEVLFNEELMPYTQQALEVMPYDE
eukprot:Hpha_TRINITY_DN16793_c1_g5::TRINITY_DN16793_c1_g5_i1::g.76353::m.76353